MSVPIDPRPHHSGSVGYVKLHVRARLPSTFNHPAALRDSSGRILGFFFFFDATPAARRVALANGTVLANVLQDAYHVTVLGSLHDMTGYATEELFALEGQIALSGRAA